MSKRPRPNPFRERSSPSPAYTLVELLVVLALLTSLIALIVPSVGRARETTRMAVCQSNLRQFANANVIYASRWRGYYVPLSTPPDLDENNFWLTRWMQNPDYQSTFAARNEPTYWWGWSIWPRGMLCPDQPAEHQEAEWNMWRVYAFNRTGFNIVNSTLGYRRSEVHHPATTAQMVDASDWHTAGSPNFPNDKPNYETWWDVHGENFGAGRWQMVSYRHRESANIVHFDGHTERYAKEQAWTGEPGEINRIWKIKK